MTEYLLFTDHEGKKVVGYHNSAPAGSGLIISTVKEVIIPSMIEEIEVVEIGYNCFRSTGIRSVFIPKTLQYLKILLF